MTSYPQFKSVPRPLITDSTKTLKIGKKGPKYLLHVFFKKSVLYS